MKTHEDKLTVANALVYEILPILEKYTHDIVAEVAGQITIKTCILNGCDKELFLEKMGEAFDHIEVRMKFK